MKVEKIITVGVVWPSLRIFSITQFPRLCPYQNNDYQSKEEVSSLQILVGSIPFHLGILHITLPLEYILVLDRGCLR